MSEWIASPPRLAGLAAARPRLPALAQRLPRGARTALRALGRECEIGWLHTWARLRIRNARLPRPLRLHLGCGGRARPGWIGIGANREADYALDVRRRWPFANASVARIYSEHFFETLAFPDEVDHFLAEALRVLQPGGVLSTGVPDTEEILGAYVRRSRAWLARLRGRQPVGCDAPLHAVNDHFRRGGRDGYAYDFETLQQVLERAGFEAVEERPFDPALDSEQRRDGTLYVEARRPR